jgi:hypothetical protein
MTLRGKRGSSHEGATGTTRLPPASLARKTNRDRSTMNLTIAKRALGLLSIALGIVAVAAPRRVAGTLGLDADEAAVSAFGAREIASGSGLLSPVKPGPWFWTRVGGDLMDLTVLGKSLGRDNPRRHIAAAATLMVAVIAVIDTVVAVQSFIDKRANAQAAT